MTQRHTDHRFGATLGSQLNQEDWSSSPPFWHGCWPLGAVSRRCAQAVDILAPPGITTLIYNHQLCVLDWYLWPYAIRSISDWKNGYLDICHPCSVRNACGGVFTPSGNRLSQHLRPVP